MFKVLWDEVFRNFAEKNDPDKSACFRSSMQKNVIDEFSDCIASPGSFTSVGLKDKDDEHILAAAAVVAGAELLLLSVSDHIKSLSMSKPDRGLYCNSLEKAGRNGTESRMLVAVNLNWVVSCR